MPDFLRTRIPDYLGNLLDDILIRDIAVRHGVKDVNSLRQLCVYLLTNIGNSVSANKITGMFGIKAASSLLDYFSYLRDSYLMEFVPMFDYSIKKQARNPKKAYSLDLGIRKQNSTSFTEDTCRVLENAVFISLRRRFKEVYYFKGKGECDFAVAERGKVLELIQVCAELDDLNIKRETDGLFEAMSFFGKSEGCIVTLNQTDSFSKDGMTIRVLPAYRFDC